MSTRETSRRNLAETMSAMMFTAGVLTLGLGGFLMLCGLAYAMVTENLVLGVGCVMVLLSEYVLGAVWLFAAGAASVPDRVPGASENVAEVYSKS
jgi:hypothetical protein